MICARTVVACVWHGILDSRWHRGDASQNRDRCACDPFSSDETKHLGGIHGRARWESSRSRAHDLKTQERRNANTTTGNLALASGTVWKSYGLSRVCDVAATPM
eukprot:6467087-Amphidinium_carterae.1